MERKNKGKTNNSKKSRTPEEHLLEKARRRTLIKNLDKLQSNSYELRVAKRYPALNQKRVEQYLSLPTMSEILDINVLFDSYPLNAKIRRIAKKSNLTPLNLYQKCGNAYSELAIKIHSNKETKNTDIYSPNVMVDINEKGKIIFTLIDF
ncbi:MAG: hypothetical protein WC462_01385 [archaeon]